MKYSLIITLFISFSAAAQADLIQKTNKAVSAKDLKSAQQICTDVYWSAKDSPNGKQRFQEFIDNRYTFSVEKTVVNDSLAIYTVQPAKNGKKLDKQLYFYFELTNLGWKIDEINDLETYHPHYLSGRVDGHFHPNSLPSSPELDLVGKQILQSMHEKDAHHSLLQEMESNQINMEELKKLDSLRFKQTYFSEKMDQGVIEYEYTTADGVQSLSLYLKRHPIKRNNWEVYNKDYYPPTINLFFLDKNKPK